MNRTLFSTAVAFLLGASALLGAAAGAQTAAPAENKGGCVFGNELAQAFNDGDTARALKMLDINGFATRTAKSFSDNAREQADFARGIVQSAGRNLLSGIFKLLETSGGSVKCMKGAAPFSGRALLRFDLNDQGFDYLEFVLEKDDAGRYHAVDWYQLSGGELLSVSAGALGRLMTDPNPGVMQSLFGVTTVDREVLEGFRKIGSLQRAGKYGEVVAIIDKLPEGIATSRAVLRIRATNASFAKMEDEYKRTLVTLASKHGNDPAAAVMLLDHYFYEKKVSKVMEAMAAIERRVGVDGMTTLLKANGWLIVGDYAQTVALAKESIRLEPDREDPYHSLAVGYVGLKNYAEAVQTYSTLESKFGIRFQQENFAEDGQFAQFIKSAEFARWQSR